MAKSILLLVALLISALTIATADGYEHRNGMLPPFHFFVHSSSPVKVAAPANVSATQFGVVYVLDDPITTTADPKSTKVGQLQGMLAFSSHSEISMSTYVNIFFTNKTYNGSQIVLAGQYQYASKQKELAIVGGTRSFRFANGFALFSTVPDTGNSILEVNVFVNTK